MEEQITLLTFYDLQRRGIRISQRQLLRLEEVGQFPARVHLSHRVCGWVPAEIESWLAARIAERDAPASRAA